MQREKVEQAHVVQLLRSLGATVYTLGTRRRRGDYQGTMQTPGVPDLYAFLPLRANDDPLGKALWIEAKAPGGRLRPEQRAFQAFCQERYIDHVVGGLDAVIAWLIEHDYLKRESVPHYRLPKAASEVL